MTPERQRALRRRFVVLTALRWFPTGLTIPVLVLVLTARGVPLPVVGAVFAAYGATTALLELPTGGLADVVGRRRVLAASSVLVLVADVLLALGTTLAVLVASRVLAGVGRALDSGPLEAWYVDAARADDPDADLGPGLSYAAAASALALAAGSLAGGALTLVPLPTEGDGLLNLSVPLLAAAALGVVHLVAVLTWVHDPAPARAGVAAVWRGVPVTVVRGGRAVAGNRVLRRLALRGVAVGLVLTTAELLTPVQFGDPIGADGYGALVTAAFVGTAVGARVAPLLARAVRGTGRGLLVATALAAVALAALGLLPGWPAQAAAYVCLYAALGLDDPLIGQLLHDETADRDRATVLSVQSLVLQSGGLVGNFAVPSLAAAASIATAEVVVAGVLLLAALTAVGLPRGRGRGVPAQAATVTSEG